MIDSRLEADQLKAFIFAGKAIFTIVSKATEKRFTYRIKLSNDKSTYFVGMLNGPENTNHYGYLGFIRADSLDKFIHGGMKACAGNEAMSVKAFGWFWKNVLFGDKGDQVEVYHSGKCGRCGRMLTVPESIKSGIGPECAKHL